MKNLLKTLFFSFLIVSSTNALSDDFINRDLVKESKTIYKDTPRVRTKFDVQVGVGQTTGSWKFSSSGGTEQSGSFAGQDLIFGLYYPMDGYLGGVEINKTTGSIDSDSASANLKASNDISSFKIGLVAGKTFFDNSLNFVAKLYIMNRMTIDQFSYVYSYTDANDDPASFTRTDNVKFFGQRLTVGIEKRIVSFIQISAWFLSFRFF